MITTRLWWRLVRRQESQRLGLALSSIAFAVTAGVLLTVLGGLRAFQHRGGDPSYPLLAEIATAILTVPVLTLGGAAARLAVSRRDERLAALRLAGATTGQVGLIAVVDAASQALVGSLLGVGLYLVALPGVAQIHFEGRAFAWAELWVGFSVLALAVAGVVALSVLSAVFSLARLAISPLGVAARTTPRRLTWLRLVIAVIVLACWAPAFHRLDSIKALTGVLVVFGLCFAVLNLVGPLILGLIGRIAVGAARTAPQLLAARRLVDDPKSAWRTVAGVTLATFVSGVLSVAPALSGAFGDTTLARDIVTGSVLTLVIAALLAAVSSGVTQAARLLDQREQYALLHLAGTDLAVLRAARWRESWLPLSASVGIAAGTSLVMVAPLGVRLIWQDPSGLALFIGGVAVSLALVMLAVGASQPMVRQIATGRARARDESLLAR